jgi:hypothetical protein
MRDVVGVIPLVKGGGHLGPSELHWGNESVDNVDLLLSDAVLPVGFVRLGPLNIMRQGSASGNSASSS